MSSIVRSLGIAVVVTALGVGLGLLIHGPTRTAPPPPSYGAPLASVDTTVMPVARTAFCGRVPHTDVVAALGGRLRSATAYTPGQRARVARKVTDVADEYACAWHGTNRVARAWVFAPPVTRTWAQHLAVTPHGCRSQRVGRYGRPSVAYACGGTTTVAGLFGDAWLSCSLTSHDVAVVGRWCVAVARAAG